MKHLSGALLLGRLLSYPTTIRLGWKFLPGENTLAYYEHSSLTAAKTFITPTPCRSGRRSCGIGGSSSRRIPSGTFSSFFRPCSLMICRTFSAVCRSFKDDRRSFSLCLSIFYSVGIELHCRSFFSVELFVIFSNLFKT